MRRVQEAFDAAGSLAQTRWVLLPTTAPDPPTNLRLVPGTFGVTAITVAWDPAPSGNKEALFMYRIFKLSIENDLDPGAQRGSHGERG
jgi:hypothetical protein